MDNLATLLCLGVELEDWRAARQDIFDNTSSISEENTGRWIRLSKAEHALMQRANQLKSV